MPASRPLIARFLCVAFVFSCTIDDRSPSVEDDELDMPQGNASGAAGSLGASPNPGAPNAANPGEPGAMNQVPGAANQVPGSANGGSGGSEGVADPALSPMEPSSSTSASPDGTLAIQVEPASIDFGPIEVGTTSAPQVVTLSNTGTAPTGPLFLENAAPGGLGVGAGCSAGLAPGETCQVELEQSPSVAGVSRTSFGIGNDAVGFVNVAVRVDARFRLSIQLVGPGGRVTSTDGAINCGGSCTALVSPEVPIELRAGTLNGTGSLVEAWSDAACGTRPRCTISLTQSQTLRVSYRLNPNNVAFATSITLPANLGGAAAYDEECTNLADQAGLLAPGGFVALLSDNLSHVSDRLGPSRGWVGLDGLPFIDTFDQLVEEQLVYYPMRYDELGGDYWRRPGFDTFSGNLAVWTGMDSDGTVPNSADVGSCENWSSTTTPAVGGIGVIGGGPFRWSGSGAACSESHPVVCLENGKTAPLSITRAAGKLIWITQTAYLVGSMTPDAKCQLEKPAAVATARAFVSTSGVAGSAALDATATYVRADGLVIGTGAALIQGELPIAPIWHLGNGAATSSGLWSGSPSPTLPGTPASTCDDWTNPAGTGDTGVASIGGSPYWGAFRQQPCSDSLRLLCVEQ